LVLHGAGNTSVKGTFTNRLGEAIPAVYVKASGHDLATLEPDGLPGLDLGYLRKLRALETLDDEAMANELRTHLFDARSATPSLETLVHAFLPAKFVDHTHADAILALSNQVGGERVVREALGGDVVVLGYVRPGFQLARAARGARVRRRRAGPGAGPHAAAHLRPPDPHEGVPALDRSARVRRAGAARRAGAGRRAPLRRRLPRLRRAPRGPPARRPPPLRRPAARRPPPRPRRALRRRRRARRNH